MRYVQARWPLDLALLILVWRLAINDPASWWRDPPAILTALFIVLTLAERRREPTRSRVASIAALATMALLLGLFAWRQIPHTLTVLGFAP
jgi:hypothetical protein